MAMTHPNPKTRPVSCYDTLGVSPGASDADIRRAYRDMAIKLHPDHNPGNPNAAKRLQQLTEAYARIKTGKQRTAYDNWLRTREQTASAANGNAILRIAGWLKGMRP